jgi:peptide/nickel transport system substrate-binding protein
MNQVFKMAPFLLVLLSFFVTPAIAQDKTLRMPVISHPPSLGNPFMANGLPSALMWFALFDALVRTNDKGELEPALALSWEAVSSTRWRFKLRDGVLFSNGEVFDAHAAAAVLRWLVSEDGKSQLVASEVQGISSVAVVDRLTLDITTRAPDAILPKRLTAVLMVAPDSWSALGKDAFALTPSGTGPFRLSDWNKGGAAEVVAFKQSWRAPKIDRILFYQIPEETALIQALQSQQVDLTTTLSPDAASDLETMGFETLVTPTAQVLAFAFNMTGTKVEALRDVRVRTALNLAVDRAAISNIVLRGTQQPAGQPGTPLTFGYEPDLEAFSHDVSRAKRLLEDAGYPDGFKITAEAVVAGNADASLVYQLVQQGLRDIGVEMELRSIVYSDWIRKYTTGTFESDLFSLAWNSEPYYDVVRPMEYYSCAKPVPFFCHEALMPLLDETGITFDEEERRDRLQALSRAYREQAPAIFILEVSEIAVIADYVRNYRVRTRVPVYEELELER